MPSYIELEKNASIPAASNEGKVILGIDLLGNVTTTNSSGSLNTIGGITTATYAEMETLISNSSLLPGGYYMITGSDSINGLYGGTDIIVQAVSVNALGTKGYGKFYNPGYDQTTIGFGVWTDLVKFQTYNLSGSFQYNEDYYGNGTLLGVDPLDINQSIVFDTDFDGGYNFLRPDSYTDDWSVVTSLTGSNSGATIEVTNLTAPSYASGSKVFWGGRVWGNLTGDTGFSNNPFELDNTNWVLIPYNNTDYNVVWDQIEYDFENDFITMRKDSAGNIVEQSYNDWLDWGDYRAIKTFQWGNPYNENENCGMGQNKINNSVFFTVNFRGRTCRDNEVKNFSSFGFNSYFEDDTRIRENVINNSSINDNFFSGDNCNFRNNVFNDCWIEYNYMAGYVNMDNNSFNGSSFYNNSLVYADINNNTLTDSSIYSVYAQYGCSVDDNLLHNSNIGGGGGNLYLTYYCSISNNSLLNSSYINGINITNNSDITYNNLSNQSYITSITADDGYIRYNNLVANSEINTNTIALSSYISYNVLASEGAINNNTIVSSSYFEYNNINSSMIDNNNTVSGSISIYANTLNNNSSIYNNIMDNGQSITNNALFNNYTLQSQTTTLSNQFYANIP